MGRSKKSEQAYQTAKKRDELIAKHEQARQNRPKTIQELNSAAKHELENMVKKEANTAALNGLQFSIEISGDGTGTR
jgi:phage-related protein